MAGVGKFDVVVVGAGPTGCSAALALGRAGMRVALIEKGVLPRHKTCGGGVLRRALTMLPADVASTVERNCHVAELRHHAPDLFFALRREQPVVAMVMRDRFDHLFAIAARDAGAEIFSDTTVREVARDATGVELHTDHGRFAAKFVIAADGVGSAIAKKCGLPDLTRVIPALECEVTVDAPCFGRTPDKAHLPGLAEDGLVAGIERGPHPGTGGV